jgi:hypothetical protein
MPTPSPWGRSQRVSRPEVGHKDSARPWELTSCAEHLVENNREQVAYGQLGFQCPT